MEVRKKLGEILLDANSITKTQLDEALREQVSSNNKLGELLVEMGTLTPQRVTEALGLQFMLPVVNIRDYLHNITAINSLPRSFMQRCGVFPLELQNNGNTLVVAISDPLDVTVQSELRMVTPLDVRFALATKQDIYAALSGELVAAPAEGASPVSEQPSQQQVQPVLPAAELKKPQPAAAPQPTEPPQAVQAPAEPEVTLAAAPAAPTLPAAELTPAQQPAGPAVTLTAAAPAIPIAPVLPAAELVSAQQSAESVAPAAPVLPAAEPEVTLTAAAPAIPIAPTLPAAELTSAQQSAEPQAAAEPEVTLTATPPVPVAQTSPVTQIASTQQPTEPQAPQAAAGPAPVVDKPMFPGTGSVAEMMRMQPKLGDILVQAGVLSETQLTEALQRQRGAGKRLGEMLISEGIITETRLSEALSTQLKLPMFTLTRFRAMPEAIRSVPRSVSERLNLIPLSIAEGDMLLIAMVDPLDLLAQDEVRMLTGRDLKIGITTATEIKNNLDRLYNLQGNLEEAIVEVYKDGKFPTEEAGEAEPDDAPVISLVSNLLEQAVREGASDIHVEPYDKTARIRYRVDGGLYTAMEYPVALHPAVSARMKIMGGMDIAEKRKPQDGRILMKVAGRRIDLRVSSLPTMNGEKMVLRILDQESSAVGLDRLGLEDDDMEKINVFCNTPWGIMLVTGPTGSGKSTTLYSILQKINNPDVNIITVEDPVEFTVAGINQVHVNEKAGLTFESALRSILRQDPDKVMVGEIRDQKTAQIAIRAALTGHFVLSTLHTNDAPSAATRIIDMGVAPFLVSASLSGIIAQRLVRKLCQLCKQEYEIPPNMCDSLEIPHGSRAWKPVGCNDCRQGYKGRKGIYEIMLIDDELRRLILEGASNIVLRVEAIKRGMKTLRKSGINNALAGLTSVEEVFSTTL